MCPYKLRHTLQICYRNPRIILEHLGCSRPLCSSQATDGPAGPPVHPPQQPWSGLHQTNDPYPSEDKPRPNNGRLPQDPTVCSTDPPTGPTAFPPTTEAADVLATDPRPADRRSSMFHPEQPPDARSAPTAAVHDHPPTRSEPRGTTSSMCSLERR